MSLIHRHFACSALLVALIFAGCRKAAPPPAPAKKAPPRVSAADIAKYKPNEAGAIMVIMYHRFRAAEPSRDLNRPPADFKRDLETLYKNNYYPVNASDIVDNKLDVPLGKTPVAMTFDDSLPTQFQLVTGGDGQQHIDPNCAVGIMESFAKAHSDWPTRGTFFVLPKEGKNGDPFGQADSVGDKFSYLLEHGYEIANHTSTHSSMRPMNAAKIQWELATAHKDILAIAKNAQLAVMALPYGKLPRDKAARAALLQGKDGTTSYQHKAVFLAAWRPILPAITKNDKKFSDAGQFALYDAARLERIAPDARHAGQPGTLEYWLKFFQTNPSARYVSDGDAKICTVPASRQSSVDAARVQSSGQKLQVYGGAKSSGGAGGSKNGLSVESAATPTKKPK